MGKSSIKYSHIGYTAGLCLLNELPILGIIYDYIFPGVYNAGYFSIANPP